MRKTNISIADFVKAKTELRDNIRDAIIMFVEDFHRKTGVYPNGTIAFEQQYDEECEEPSQPEGMAVMVSLVTDLDYDD